MMTYIEPQGWCSSPKCPSNVDKSMQLCPILSSSIASTSLISNSNSISLNTDAISTSSSSSSSSYGKEKKASTFIQRSSLGQPHDYYTKKRIEELHERMDDIQISNFLNFLNYHLSLKPNGKKLHINDLSKDLSNGHILIDLIEIFSSTKLKREHGHTRFHSLTNIQYVLDYLKLHMQHIHISPHDILSGNRKQILALLWIIIKTFDFPSFRLTTNRNSFVENTLLGFGQDRSLIIKWLNNILNKSLNTQQIYIKDFYIQTWSNGYYFSIILKYLLPLSPKYLTEKSFNYLKQLEEMNQQCLELCWNLANYCFNTITILDYTDKNEICLFKFFTELQQNVFIILKTNHIGKLIQNNPYAQQILETVSQTTTKTTTEHSPISYNDEQYVSCVKDNDRQAIALKHMRLAMNSMGHSTSSSDDCEELPNLRTVEKSRLFTDEQEKAKLKRKNRWNESENLQSNSPMMNGHSGASKEKKNEVTTDEPNQLTAIANKSEQPAMQITETKQITVNYEKGDQAIVTTQGPEQSELTIEQPLITHAETEQQTTVINHENEPNKNLEQSLPKIRESEQITTSQKEIEQDVGNRVSTNKTEKSEQVINSIEKPSQFVTANKESEQIVVTPVAAVPSLTMHEKLEQPQQSTNEYEKSKQAVTSFEDIERPVENDSSVTNTEQFKQSAVPIEESQQLLTSNEEVEQSDVQIKPLKQTALPIIVNELSLTSNEKLEQPTVESEDTEQLITSNEENIKSTDEYEKSKQTVTSLEDIQRPVENDSSVTNTEQFKQSADPIEESQQLLMSNKEVEQSDVQIKQSEQTTLPIINNDLSMNINGELEQPTVESKDTEQLITSNEENHESTVNYGKLDEPSVSIQENEQPIENKIFTTTDEKLEQPTINELPQPALSNDETQQITVKPIEHETSVSAHKKSELAEHLIVANEKSLQPVALTEEPALTLIENHFSVTTNKILEQSAVVESQPPFILNKEMNQSATVNEKSEKFNATTEERTQTAIPIQESENLTNSNEQSTIIVKESERSVDKTEESTSTAVIFNGNKDSDATNLNNESKQATASSKQQEYSVVSKKKRKSITVLAEKPKQSLIIAEENKQIPITHVVKEQEQSEVTLENQTQSVATIEEPSTSAISNGDAKKSSNKYKKSKRPTAKKGKPRNVPVKTESSSQVTIVTNEDDDEEEEEVEPSLSPLNIANTIEQQNPSIIESEVQNSSTTPKPPPIDLSNEDTSINNENPSNPSALRSRKNKKKKTTSTTIVKPSPPPIIPTTTTTATTNRNLFVVIKECLNDPKMIAFKYVFILVCLCFSILIIFVHK